MITVVIPLFNKEQTIARAIESVLRQTYSDFQLKIIDDGSSDKSLAIAQSFSDPRIAVVTQKNAGPGAARNAGVHLGDRPYVAFLDADDEWMPGYLNHHAAILKLHNSESAIPSVAASVCGYFEKKQNASMPTPTSERWLKRGIPNGAVIQRGEGYSAVGIVSILAFMSPWSTVVSKSIFLKYGGFYEHKCLYAEDSYLWLQVLVGEVVFFSLDPHVIYHREDSGLTGQAKMRPVEPFVEHFDNYIARFDETSRTIACRVVALRGLKTACLLGLYGERARGIDLFNKLNPLTSLSALKVATRLANTRLGPFLMHGAQFFKK